MLSYVESLDLMRKYSMPDNIIRHCMHTSKIAVFLAIALNKKGLKIDIGLVQSAALVHDIDKLISDKNSHGIIGARMLEKIGESEIAKIIKKHRFDSVNISELVPNTWEEKLVYYADKRDDNSKLVSIEERLSRWEEKYGKSSYYSKASLSLKKIESEIFAHLDFLPDDLDNAMENFIISSKG